MTNESHRSGADADITLRVAASTYVVVVVVFGALAAYSAYNALNDPGADWRGTVFLLALLAVFLVYFFGRLRLTVSQGVLRYRNLFGERALPLSDIVRSEFRRKLFARDPRPILLITSEGRAKPLQVNLTPFRRDDVTRFLENPGLKIEKRDEVG